MTSAALAADLHALSVTLDDADVDIVHTFTQLDAAAAGVGSYLGLCVTVTGRDTAGQLSTMPDHHGEDIGSSVTIPLPTIDNAQLPVVTLVLYARTPGAFTDLAADLAWMTGKDHTQFRLDQDLNPPPAGRSRPERAGPHVAHQPSDRSTDRSRPHSRTSSTRPRHPGRTRPCRPVRNRHFSARHGRRHHHHCSRGNAAAVDPRHRCTTGNSQLNPKERVA